MMADESLYNYQPGTILINSKGIPSGPMNLSVSIVGWGHETVGNSTIPYWRVRNQWGSFWGNDGYFNIILGDNIDSTNYYI